LRLPAGIFIVLSVAAFYVWTATSSEGGWKWEAGKMEHYDQLAEGFLSGHLYLAQAPPKEMLALKDPLDPIANGPYRLHDAALYKGRYYLYFGPVPVLTLYLPWRMVTGFGIATNLATVLFVLAGYIFSCLLLFLLLAACGIQPSPLSKRIAIAALGLCQTAPIILRRASVYETAIASAYCFFMAGMYFLGRYVLAEKPVRWHVALAGLFLGMTAGCRPNYAPVAALVLAAYVVYLRRSRQLGGRALMRETFWFGGPIAACGLLLAWYNYARFGSPLELGMTYQLVAGTSDRGISSDLSNVLPALYGFLVQMPVRFLHFPFLELSTLGPFGTAEWTTSPDHVEPIAGILAISPLCVFGCLMPLLFRRFGNQVAPTARFMLIALYVSAIANLIAIIMVVAQACQRYEMDFAPQLLLISLFLVLYLAARLDDTRFRRAAVIALVVGAAGGAGAQAALSINSYDNMLMWRNPAGFEKLAMLFGDDQRSTRRMVSGLSLRGDIKFSQPPLGTREAFLTSGVRGYSNAIVVQYPGMGKVRFGFFMSGKAVAYGPEIAVEPLRSYQVRFEYRSDRGAAGVLLDGNAVLDVSPTYVYPTSIGDATVGRDGIGEIAGVEPFSGEIRSPDGLQIAAVSK